MDIAVKVRTRRVEADDILGFELESADGTRLPPFTAGAHIDVHIAPGLVRQYSLCGDPHERDVWRIGVQRERASRGGSAGVHDSIHPGAVLKVGAPRNLFELSAAPHSVLVAGGIGVTPILSMAKALHRQGQSFDFHYCASSLERMAFREEIRSSGFQKRARFYVGASPAEKFDPVAALQAAPGDAHVYVCGPSGFMDFVLSAAQARGWPPAQLHREHFAAAVVDTTGDQPFQIRLQRIGVTLDVPVDTSVLQVLLNHGVEVDYSCEGGVCGNCATRVLEGSPDHRDTFLTDAERAAGDVFTPCCSRARTPMLVLDL